MSLTHSQVITSLENSQGSEEDSRDMAQEADLFLNARDGQWEPRIARAWVDRPRYTIDQVNPVLNGVLGEMARMDFAISCTPNGGGATVAMAEKYAGIIRSIENMSKSRYIYKHAARVMTGQGLSGWRVVTKERVNNPFVQDLVIEEITDFKQRVWFDDGTVKRTAEDAEESWVLSSIPLAEYNRLFPKGSGSSVSDGRKHNAYRQKKTDVVVIGERYFQKVVKKTFVLMSNGRIYEVTPDFDKVRDELLASGIAVTDERETDTIVMQHQLFDGADFLNDPVDTVFNSNPVIPCYANWDISENRIIYWGLVEKLMDPQRILNYAESKKVAESALKPVEKVWIEKGQAEDADVLEGLATANVNSDPHQFYNHVEGVPAPFKQPAQQPDGVLIETAASSKQYIKDTSNYNDAARGVGLSGQSGETVNRLQNKGNISNFEYYTAMEIAIGRTADVLTPAIPKIYDTPQEMNLINLDGTQESYNILDRVFDKETRQYVTINDLSVGNYQVTCSAGPAFQSSQQEAARNMLAAANAYPPIMERGSDIFLRNLNDPAMNLVADRMRKMLLEQGAIPDDQMTDEEKAYVAQKTEDAKQSQANDPLSQAQLGLAQAELKKAEAQVMDTVSKMEERQQKAQADLQKMIIDAQFKSEQLAQLQQEKLVKMISAQAEVLNTHTDTLKKLRDAMGVETVVGPGVIETYAEQVDVISEHQNNQQ